jgi:hypothetical protein
LDHPAFRRRIDTARQTGRVPGLIVTGGDRVDRDIVAAAYATALIDAGLVDERHVRCAAETHLSSPDRLPDPDRKPYGDDLVIVTEIGAHAGGGLPEPPYGDPGTFGYAPLHLDRVLHQRHRHQRPIVLTSPLAPGNREGAADLTGRDHLSAVEAGGATTVVLVSGPNMGLLTTLDERAQAGWTLPGELGFDPDAQIVPTAAPPTVQEYLGGRIWWRLYKNAYGTAVNARGLATALGLV